MSENPHKENVHEGHRDRLRKEFLNHGFDKNTPSHKMLELLLFYCIPRIDTNEIAHKMINRYKNLAGVLDAPVSELAEFKGMTERSALLLKLIMPMAQRYLNDKAEDKPTFKNLDEIGKYIVEQYLGAIHEKAGLLCMDAKCKLISFDFIAEGDISSVGISIRELMRHVLEQEACIVVLCHNHPGGVALPSRGDTNFTALAADSLSKIGVHLLDHIIVAANDFVSLAQSTEYSHMFEYNR